MAVALIDPRLPDLCDCAGRRAFAKLKSNIMEVRARNGKVIALTNPGVELDADDLWIVPKIPAPLSALAALPCLAAFQLPDGGLSGQGCRSAAQSRQERYGGMRDDQSHFIRGKLDTFARFTPCSMPCA